MQSNIILIISISRRKNVPTVGNWQLAGCYPSCEDPIVVSVAWVPHRTVPGSRATPRSCEDVTSCRRRQGLQTLRHRFLPQESNPLSIQSSVKMIRDSVLTKDVSYGAAPSSMPHLNVPEGHQVLLGRRPCLYLRNCSVLEENIVVVTC